jgi:cyclophilin family peptidyl-prolyl cis-trans isomerase
MRVVLAIAVALALADLPAPQSTPAAAKPVIVMQTDHGAFEMELYPADSPKSVQHLMDLFKRDFYRGFRFHRVTASLVQIGDPQSRNMRLENLWGTMSSGSPIGVAEISKTRKHVRGSVGLAHSGDPKFADSQIYVMKTASPSLDGKHAVIGQVVKGIEVVDKIQKGDVLKLATIKGAAPK